MVRRVASGFAVNIPIRNIYFLLLYAWAQFPAGPITTVGVDQSPDVPNLLANLLASGIRKLLRRGLDRGYSTFTAELIGLRGRLRIDRMIEECTQLKGTAICDFDDLTHDVLHNRILKATVAELSHCPAVEERIRHDLKLVGRRLRDVRDLRLNASCFRQVVISGNNREYLFLIQLCEFVYWSLMPEREGTGARFKQVLDDELRMSAVFENFLRNFFRQHRADYRVRAEASEWNVTDATQEDLALLPRMLTDITLRNSERTIIIDAKYYRKPLAEGPYGERVRSQHLYQLITYLQHERVRDPAKHLCGMLLYPDVGRSLRLKYRLLNIPVLVATVDLGKEWQEIAYDLSSILDECAGASA